MIQIPTISTGLVGEYTEQVLLDNAVFTLKFSWNEQADHWMLSVFDSADVPIVQGRMIVNGVDLLRGCVVPTRPRGALFAGPLDGRNEHAGLTGLGSRVALYYRGVDE